MTATNTEPWAAPHATGPVDAVIEVPGSKSIMARELVLGALAIAPSTIRGALRSRDSLLMHDALVALGARVRIDGDDWTITPIEPDERADVQVNCGLSGTVMRFLPALAALTTRRVGFDGDRHARTRPMRGLLDALRAAGVRFEPGTASALPFSVLGAGTIAGGAVSVEASASSQFVTGLMLAAPRFDRGGQIRALGPVPSAPHLAMTVDALTRRGVPVETDGRTYWNVPPSPIAAADAVLEPDLSNAAPFVAAAVVTGGTVTIRHWPRATTQPGAHIADIAAMFGATVRRVPEGLRVTGADVHGVDLDLSEASELTPVIAAICLFAGAPSRLRGVAHIRGHETDRLAALATEFSALGARVQELPDGLRITPAPLHASTIATYGDHRIAHAAAVIGLRVPGCAVENIETTAKTMPDFARRWTRMIAGSDDGAPVVSEYAR